MSNFRHKSKIAGVKQKNTCENRNPKLPFKLMSMSF